MFIQLSLFYSIIFFSLNASAKYYLDHETDFEPFGVERHLRWNAFIDFENPNNWLPERRLPCSKDIIKLPSNYAIYLNNKLAVSEVILDPNGELIFGSSSIQFPFIERENGKRCDGKAAQILSFLPSKKSSWFSVANWLLRSNDPAREYSYNKAKYWQPLSNVATYVSVKTITNLGLAPLIPDTERIPCNGDWLYFPTRNGSFKVNIDRTDILPSLGSVIVGTKAYMTTQSFRNLLDSSYGTMLFTTESNQRTMLEISPKDSLNQFQLCGNDRLESLQTICKYSIQHCMKPICKDPIQPAGHCCPICASALLIKPKKSAKQSDLAELHQATYRALRTLSKDQFLSKVRFYAHWLSDSSYQIIVDDFEWALANHKGPNLPRNTENYLISLYDIIRKINGNFDKKFLVQSIKASTNFYLDSELFDSVLFLIMFLMVISPIVCAISAIVLCRLYKKNRSDPAFTFVRFQSQTHDIELDIDPQIKSILK